MPRCDAAVLAAGRLPELTFEYALIDSTNIKAFPAAHYWFLNDLGVTTMPDGSYDLFGTQFGPFGLTSEVLH